MRWPAARMRINNYEIPVEGLDQPILVRHNPRARRLTLRVSQTQREAVLTVPPKTRIEDAKAFLHSHLDWLREKLDTLPSAVPFADGMTIPLRGEDHLLCFLGSGRHGQVVWVRKDEARQNRPGPSRTNIQPSRSKRQLDLFGQPDTICKIAQRRPVYLPLTRERGPDVTAEPTWRAEPNGKAVVQTIYVSGDVHHAPRRLRDWLRHQAREDLVLRVSHHANRLGLRPSRITVRDQATRWGSCSSNGTLSFSWRLILAPPMVLDYVAAHEVAHLKELNHSIRFWTLVEKAMPEMNAARAWLKQHGTALHRYGVER